MNNNPKIFFQRKGGFQLSAKGLTIAQLPKRRIDATRDPDPYIDAKKESEKATLQ